MDSGQALAPVVPRRRWVRTVLRALLATALAVAFTGGGQARPAAASPPPELDAGGAYAFLAFCRDLQGGHPWSEAAIRSLAGTAPYRALIAHHASLDPSVTAEAFVAMLLALRDGRPYSGPTGRLVRIYATYSAALQRLPELQSRLDAACASNPVPAAFARARASLPGDVRLPTRVYLIADGFTPVYDRGDAVVLDLLEATNPGQIEAFLAHELHLVATASLLPAPCPDPQVGLALDTLAGMVQEGAASTWVDHWRAAPLQGDPEAVAGFMRAVLTGTLPVEEAEPWFAALVDDGREGGGPLYRVGNAMIADLTERRGQAWVQARLGDPVGLLRDWQGLPSVPFHEVSALLDRARDRCPAWFPGSQ